MSRNVGEPLLDDAYFVEATGPTIVATRPTSAAERVQETAPLHVALVPAGRPSAAPASTDKATKTAAPITTAFTATPNQMGCGSLAASSVPKVAGCRAVEAVAQVGPVADLAELARAQASMAPREVRGFVSRAALRHHRCGHPCRSGRVGYRNSKCCRRDGCSDESPPHDPASCIPPC